ncbi:Mblk-1-related factor [Trichinella spiralis]|uniref:Mblk-1-related factor n=1 Tax=Trichinella spiralis TaxID=6334 RepID=A0ABR3L0T5_TRISP
MPSRSMLLGLIGLDAVRNATRHAVMKAVQELCTNTDSRAAGNVADRSSIVDSRPQMTAEATSDGAGSRSSSDANQLDEANAKKLRRKRGQYRKYDKNALALAVQSVRRGEMSVHKAGSFYGVPHSTLEYKVKERNLLRAKKQQQAETASSSNNNKKAAENPTTPCTIAPRPNAETVENCEFLNLQYPSNLAIVENSSTPFGQTGHFVEEPNKAAATDEAINDCSLKLMNSNNNNNRLILWKWKILHRYNSNRWNLYNNHLGHCRLRLCAIGHQLVLTNQFNCPIVISKEEEEEAVTSLHNSLQFSVNDCSKFEKKNKQTHCHQFRNWTCQNLNRKSTILLLHRVNCVQFFSFHVHFENFVHFELI